MPLMALTNGTKLGPYEIVAPLGSGGMGEVYRARDTRLGRIVAVKIHPSHLPDNSTLRQRFEQEAKAISSLNHPHICILHDVGHQDGTDFLVMEYLEGETLAKLLEKGPLPLAQVLKYGVEIADALDKADRKSTRLNSSHGYISYAVFCLKKKNKTSNVLLAETRLVFVRVPQFGLAEIQPAETLSAHGDVVRTLDYIASEHLHRALTCEVP